jgi:molybdopterin synthase catalytic subunit
MSVPSHVNARLFARLREQAGRQVVPIEVDEDTTVRGVYERLREQHPALEADRELIRPARNQAYCSWEDTVQDGDELAFIPPVSGGSPAPGGAFVEITAEPLDARRLEAAVLTPTAGAICTFTGVVRNNSRDRAVTHLEYEAYPEMAENGMRAIGLEIAERWPEARVAMAHRVGNLEIGEASVVVSVSCPHRAEAIAACKWGIDRLKESVPVWKKEYAEDGVAWVEGEDLRPAP